MIMGEEGGMELGKKGEMGVGEVWSRQEQKRA